jgi:hypothetical protein
MLQFGGFGKQQFVTCFNHCSVFVQHSAEKTKPSAAYLQHLYCLLLRKGLAKLAVYPWLYIHAMTRTSRNKMFSFHVLLCHMKNLEATPNQKPSRQTKVDVRKAVI